MDFGALAMGERRPELDGFELMQRRPAWAFWMVLIAGAIVGAIWMFELLILARSGSLLAGPFLLGTIGVLAVLRYFWRNRPRAGEVLYIVRVSDGELRWGPTGTETQISLASVADVRRVDGPADFVTTEIHLKDGRMLEIGAEFGPHTQLVRELRRCLKKQVGKEM